MRVTGEGLRAKERIGRSDAARRGDAQTLRKEVTGIEVGVAGL